MNLSGSATALQADQPTDVLSHLPEIRISAYGDGFERDNTVGMFADRHGSSLARNLATRRILRMPHSIQDADYLALDLRSGNISCQALAKCMFCRLAANDCRSDLHPVSIDKAIHADTRWGSAHGFSFREIVTNGTKTSSRDVPP